MSAATIGVGLRLTPETHRLLLRLARVHGGQARAVEAGLRLLDRVDDAEAAEATGRRQ